MRLMLAAALVLFAAAANAGGIVVIGDSVAHGAGDETGRGLAGALAAVSHQPVENLGINGARTFHVLRHLDRPDVRAKVRRARLIVVSVGGNDLFGSPLERLRSLVAPGLASYLVAWRVQNVIARIHRENPSAPIVLLGLYNPYRLPALDTGIARWDGRLITRFAAWHAVNVIRIADLLDTPGALSPIDHYHPSASGYRAIAERIWAAYDDRHEKAAGARPGRAHGLSHGLRAVRAQVQPVGAVPVRLSQGLCRPGSSRGGASGGDADR